MEALETEVKSLVAQIRAEVELRKEGDERVEGVCALDWGDLVLLLACCVAVPPLYLLGSCILVQHFVTEGPSNEFCVAVLFWCDRLPGEEGR